MSIEIQEILYVRIQFPDCITNSYVLHKKYSPSRKFKRVRDFRLQLAIELIGDYYSKGHQLQPRPSHLPTFLSTDQRTNEAAVNSVRQRAREEILFGTARLASNGSATVANQRLTVFI